jgi:polysaccharide biosynthesis protein PslH
MKILFVSRWYPYPVDNGSKIRIYHLIRMLAEEHEVDLISFSSEKVNEERIKAMKPFCQKIQTTEYFSNDRNPFHSLRGFLSIKPKSAVVSYNPEMQQLIREADQGGRYDVLISSQIDMAAYTLSWKSSPKIFEELELTTLYQKYQMEQNPLARLRKRLMWLKYERFMKSMLSTYACTTVVSELERGLVEKVIPEYRHFEVVPNGVDINSMTGDFGQVEEDSLVYSGALSYYANMDAMEFFLKSIFPIIKSYRPGVKLYITGSTTGIDLKQLPAEDGVVFTGYLSDIRPRIARSMVSIVPLRIGGGTRLKILESLALRTPVVATNKGAEGLDLIADKDLLIADDPQDFAKAVVRVLEDHSLRDQLGSHGYATVKRCYDWGVVGQKMKQVFASVV